MENPVFGTTSLSAVTQTAPTTKESHEKSPTLPCVLLLWYTYAIDSTGHAANVHSCHGWRDMQLNGVNLCRLKACLIALSHLQ